MISAQNRGFLEGNLARKPTVHSLHIFFALEERVGFL